MKKEKSTTGPSRISLGTDQIIIEFPYIPDQIAEVKRIPGARWDRERSAWLVPITELAAARRFGLTHGFTIEPDLLRMDIPDHPVGESRLELNDDSAFAFFPYDPVRVGSIKRVPGAEFDRRRMAWKIPLGALASIIEWAEKFNLHIPDEVRVREEELKGRKADLMALSEALDADIDVPGLGGELMHFQKAAVKYAIENRRIFICDDMGAGKTIESLAAVEHEQTYPLLVICPPSLTLNWDHEAKTWLPHRTRRIIKGRSENNLEPADITIIGDANTAYQLDRLKKDKYKSLIVDESHRAKNHQAARTKAAIKLGKAIPEDGLVLCLTGTPITNRPAEFASQLEIMGRLQEFGGRWPFYKRYAGAWKDRFGWNITGASNLDELNERLRGDGMMIRRTKKQMLPELPEIRYATVYVEPDPDVMVEYEQAEEDIARYMAQRAAEIARELGKSPRSAAVLARIKAESAEHLVRLAALRQLAAKSKKKPIKEWIELHVDAKLKVVVAAHHRDMVRDIARPWGNLYIQGGMKADAIEEAKAKFQNEPVDIAPAIVIAIDAGGLGHTLTASQDILMAELPWTWAALSQTVARVHRIGQKGSVMATAMLAEGTIDEAIWRVLERKRHVSDSAVGDTEWGSPESVAGEILTELTIRGLDMEEPPEGGSSSS